MAIIEAEKKVLWIVQILATLKFRLLDQLLDLKTNNQDII